MKQGLNVIAEDDINRILGLGCKRYVLSHYFSRYLDPIKSRYPDSEVLTRYITKDFLHSDPHSFALSFCTEAEKWRDYTDKAYFVNEPNNPIEGPLPTGWGIAQVNQWLFAVVREIRLYASWLKIYCPPFSPAYQGIEYYYDLSRYNYLSSIFDGICVNAYGKSGEIISYCQQVQAILPEGTKLWLTEFNYGAGRDISDVYGTDVPSIRYADDVLNIFCWIDQQPCWEAACVFAYRWPTPDTALPTTVDITGQPLEATIKRYTEVEVDEATQTALIEMEARQNAILCEMWKLFRQGKFTGASGIDGKIIELQGGGDLGFTPSYPAKKA